MSINVCIPCVYPHVVHLDKCITNIAEQTLLPIEVVVSISSIPNNWAENCCRLLLNDIKKKTKLNVVYTLSYETKYAGENRNIAVANSTADIVSFIDADDIMHPNRLEIMVKAFKDPTVVGVMHYFRENELLTISPIAYDPQKLIPYMFSYMVHFGHGTFRRSLFDKYQYTDKKRGQDVEFIHNLLPEHLHNLRIYKDELTHYFPIYSSLKYMTL